MPLFLFPLAFVGLIGVPALIAIYLFRNRFRRQPVSSLMLWIDARESREGGVRLRTLQTPLLFLLELLVILALVLAAAEPFFRVSATARPLVVVLDDSYSMQAGGQTSPRRQAEEALRELLTERPPFSVRLVLAGQRPQLLGEAVRAPGEALAQLRRWQPFAPEARLEPALSLASELGGELALLLVLTDHPPPKDRVPERGRVQWWSFGRPRDNVAITAAARTLNGERDRCLLEVSNFGQQAVSRTLQLVLSQAEQPRQRLELKLQAGEVRRLTLSLPAQTGPLQVQMEADELPLDDTVDLLPVTPRPVRVAVRLANKRLNDLVRRALEATRLARLVVDQPQLLITDQTGEPELAETNWVLQFRTPDKGDPQAFTGPFVLDRTHPLLEGIALQSVIWGCAKDEQELPGYPLVLAGNTPLLTAQERLSNSGVVRHHLWMRFRPELSTLPTTPDWPILMTNLLQWRSLALPGNTRPNLRLGEMASLTLADFRDELTLEVPHAERRTLPVKGRVVGFAVDRPGIWQIHDGPQVWPVAVNACNAEESDLRSAEPGRWGDWLDETTLRQEYRGLSWLFLVALLALGCVHLYLMKRGGNR